jgi:superfamily I DNA and/or RNA helicase
MATNQKTIIEELKKALDDEISYLKEHGGDTKFNCRNGILIQASGNRYIYEFILEMPINLQEDTPISINYGGKTIIGSILRLEGVKITVTLNQDIGQKVAEITVIANPYFLLEILKERLQELEDNKIKGNFLLSLKTFGEEKPEIKSDTNFLSKHTDILNKEQKEALAKSLGSEVTFIWGPPGTGKTFTLAQIVNEFLLRNKSILLVSHTNIAIDNALERLSLILRGDKDEKYNDGKILRIGTPHLSTLLIDYPELDIQHWVEKRGNELRGQLEELERILSRQESAALPYRKIVQLLESVELNERELIKLDADFKNARGNVLKIKDEVKRLEKEQRELESTLKQAEKMNAIARFFRRLSINKINLRILQIKGLIPQNVSRLTNAEKTLNEHQKKILQTKQSIASDKEEVKELFQKLGKVLSKESALSQIELLQKDINETKTKIDVINAKLSNLERQIVSEAMVIGTTLTKAYLNQDIYQRQFDVIMVDEASMAPMPALFFDCSLGREKAIIIGDFRQLAPIAQSDTPAVKKWMIKDIFEQAEITTRVNEEKEDERLVQLKEQRRMPKEVVSLVNEIIYKNTLRNGPKDKHEQNAESAALKAEPFPSKRIVICDTSSINPWCSKSPRGSPFNIYNAFLSVELAELAIKDGITDLGIITPYSSQSRLIHELTVDKLTTDKEDIPVDPSSVHRFQGREKQVIIFDLVEGPVRNIKWLNGGLESDAMRLINVAVTRAKAKLIFIANLQYLDEKLSSESALRKILDKAKEEAEIVDCRNFFDFVDIKKKREEKESTHAPEKVNRPTFYSEFYFYEQFRKDLSNAKNSVVITSPYITVNRTTQFEELFRELLKKNVKIYIITKPPKEQYGHLESMGEEMITELKKIGVEVVPKNLTHEKFAIIDDRIIWHGSLNILSHRNTSELMLRLITNAKLWSSEILKLCGISIGIIDRESFLDKRLKEINEIGVGRCPHGHKMIIKRGSRGIFISCSQYPRCEITAQPKEDIITEIFGEDYLICEKCRSKMIIRYSAKNKSRFLGCSKYPECKFTRPI